MALAQWSPSPVGVRPQPSQDQHPTFGIEVRGVDAMLALPPTRPNPRQIVGAKERPHLRATEVTRERGERRVRKMAELQYTGRGGWGAGVGFKTRVEN